MEYCVLSDILIISNDCNCINNPDNDCFANLMRGVPNRSIYVFGQIISVKERSLKDKFSGTDLTKFVKEVIENSVFAAAIFRPNDIKCKCISIKTDVVTYVIPHDLKFERG